MPRWAEDVVAPSAQDRPVWRWSEHLFLYPCAWGSAPAALGSRCCWHVVPVQIGQWAYDAQGSKPMLPCRGHRTSVVREGTVATGPEWWERGQWPQDPSGGRGDSGHRTFVMGRGDSGHRTSVVGEGTVATGP